MQAGKARQALLNLMMMLDEWLADWMHLHLYTPIPWTMCRYRCDIWLQYGNWECCFKCNLFAFRQARPGRTERPHYNSQVVKSVVERTCAIMDFFVGWLQFGNNFQKLCVKIYVVLLLLYANYSESHHFVCLFCTEHAKHC